MELCTVRRSAETLHWSGVRVNFIFMKSWVNKVFRAQAGRASRCSGNRASYNSFYGVDATVRLDPIRVLRRTFNFGGRLPWSWRGTLLGQRDLTCGRCRGCIGRKKRDLQSAYDLLDVSSS